jgi:hypothetical protein
MPVSTPDIAKLPVAEKHTVGAAYGKTGVQV